MIRNHKTAYIFILFFIIVAASLLFLWHNQHLSISDNKTPQPDSANKWAAPDIKTVSRDKRGELIRYGFDLITNTSAFLGPKGTIAKISNGMNCQNCHLNAGTRAGGNTLALAASSYPKYRERSGRIETIAFRINECIQRSLNGNPLDSACREMQAMIAYIHWLGNDVSGSSPGPVGGTMPANLIQRAANPAEGEKVYMTKCKSCHGLDGYGIIKPDSSGYYYPPVWGPNSYNVSSGLYRISKLAGYVKYNMPYTSVLSAPQLTDEEAWDVSAFVNTMPHPEKYFKYDWPDKSKKPFDYPFGPYADSFSEKQHKYGPYLEIQKQQKKQ